MCPLSHGPQPQSASSLCTADSGGGVGVGTYAVHEHAKGQRQTCNAVSCQGQRCCTWARIIRVSPAAHVLGVHVGVRLHSSNIQLNVA